MARPSQQDQKALAAFAREAELVSLAAPRFETAERMRALLETDTAITYELECTEAGPHVTEPRTAGPIPRFTELMQGVVGKPPPGAVAVGSTRAQHDRIVTFPSFAEVARRAPTKIWRRLLGAASTEEIDDAIERMLRYARHWEHTEVFEFEQVRVLLCDRDRPFLYINSMHSQRHTPRMRYRFRRAIPVLRRRLLLERQFAHGNAERLALDAALEHIGRIAVVVGPRGQLLHANAVGRAACQPDLLRGVHEAIRGDASRFQITRLRDADAVWYLAVEQPAVLSAAARATVAASRWGLGEVQTRILVRIVEGLSNKTIAAELGLAENTVEYHVTRILGRADVEHRAALVAKVWSET